MRGRIFSSAVIADGAELGSSTHSFDLATPVTHLVGGRIFTITAVANGLIRFILAMHHLDLATLTTFLVI